MMTTKTISTTKVQEGSVFPFPRMRTRKWELILSSSKILVSSASSRMKERPPPARGYERQQKERAVGRLQENSSVVCLLGDQDRGASLASFSFFPSSSCVLSIILSRKFN